jgi:hypothetical protein
MQTSLMKLTELINSTNNQRRNIWANDKCSNVQKKTCNIIFVVFIVVMLSVMVPLLNEGIFTRSLILH